MSFWNDIKLFFRGVDIAIMRRHAPKGRMHLDSAKDVKSNFETIRSAVTASNNRMPPPPHKGWTQEMIRAYRDWKPDYALTDPALVEKTAPFVALSEFLTGFDNLGDAELANKHLARLEARAAAVDSMGPENPNAFTREDLDFLIAQFGILEKEQFVSQVMSQDRYARLARVIILLWYTAAFLENGHPVDSGTPEDNQYIQGLVWQAIQAHPMGYAPEGTRYWQNPPQADGTNTGLGIERD